MTWPGTRGEPPDDGGSPVAVFVFACDPVETNFVRRAKFFRNSISAKSFLPASGFPIDFDFLDTNTTNFSSPTPWRD